MFAIFALGMKQKYLLALKTLFAVFFLISVFLLTKIVGSAN